MYNTVQSKLVKKYLCRKTDFDIFKRILVRFLNHAYRLNLSNKIFSKEDEFDFSTCFEIALD